MEALKKKILAEGEVYEGNILKVDCFLNHQIDFPFMKEVGREFHRLYKDAGVNKILTIEASGIAVGSVLLIVPNIVQGFSWLCIPLFLAGSALGLLQSLHEIRKNRAEAEKNADPQETDETQKATSVESDTTV